MTDFAAMLLDPIYAAHPQATNAVLDLGSDGTVPLRVLDKTSGTLVDASLGGSRQSSPVQIQTVKPCADVRASELTSKAVDLSALRNASIAFNGQTWRINSFAYKPGMSGQSSGEIRLILMDN